MEFSALSSAKTFRKEHDGALCFKIASGCGMRCLATCPMWKEMPSPVFCEDLSDLSSFKDGKICFVTALVYARNDKNCVIDVARLVNAQCFRRFAILHFGKLAVSLISLDALLEQSMNR